MANLPPPRLKIRPLKRMVLVTAIGVVAMGTVADEV